MLVVVVPVQSGAAATKLECAAAPCMWLPVPVYGAVPPEAVMFTVVVPPKQPMGTCVSLALSAGGWLMVPVTTVLHPLASVTVKLKGPADTLVCVPSPVYGAVPPEAVMFTVVVRRVEPMGTCVWPALSAAGWLMLPL